MLYFGIVSWLKVSLVIVSTVLVASIISIAFSEWFRAMLVLLLQVPLVWAAKTLGLRGLIERFVVSKAALAEKGETRLKTIRGLRGGKYDTRDKQVEVIQKAISQMRREADDRHLRDSLRWRWGGLFSSNIGLEEDIEMMGEPRVT